MKTCWFGGELRVMTRNTLIEILIRKADRQDRFWARVERLCNWRRYVPQRNLNR